MSESKSGSFEEAVKRSAEAHMVKTRGTSVTRFDSFIAGAKWALEYLAKASGFKETWTSSGDIKKDHMVSIEALAASNARNVILEQRAREFSDLKERMEMDMNAISEKARELLIENEGLKRKVQDV